MVIDQKENTMDIARCLPGFPSNELVTLLKETRNGKGLAGDLTAWRESYADPNQFKEEACRFILETFQGILKKFTPNVDEGDRAIISGGTRFLPEVEAFIFEAIKRQFGPIDEADYQRFGHVLYREMLLPAERGVIVSRTHVISLTTYLAFSIRPRHFRDEPLLPLDLVMTPEMRAI